jgi:hypothetical protein
MVDFSTTELFAAAAAAAATIGGFIVRDRQVAKTIADGDAELHQRVNKVRDEYVRRDDLTGHITRIETMLIAMRDEQRRTNERIDSLLVKLVEQTK